MNNTELLNQAVNVVVDFAVLAMDLQGRVQAMNSGAQRLLGYTDRDLVGQNGDVIFTPEDLGSRQSEIEREKALQDGRAENERWHVRRDGSRFWGSGVLTTLPDGSGFIKIMRDLTDRRVSEERMRVSEERFRTLATNIPELVFTCLDDGSRTWGSPQWVVFTGLSDADSREYGWLEAIHPDDRQHTVDAWNTAKSSGAYEVEHRIRRMKDGAFRWHQTRATPLSSQEGLSSEWVGASSDVHQLRGLKESQQVLLAELQHRTRNLLAMVQSIAKRSARSASSVAEFTSDLDSRLRALSRAESLAPYASDHQVDIKTLIDAELSAHLPTGDQAGRIHIEGPHTGVPASAAQSLSLALHELATNAVKYGALRQDGAELRIYWEVIEDKEEKKLSLEWRESSVKMPEQTGARRKGYGTELIERALPYQLSAETRLEFAPDGVRCWVKVPIATHTEAH